MSARRFPLWTALSVVLIVTLVIGSGILSSKPPTAAQRATSIDSVVRCPTCEDLSVAQSTAPAAQAVRATVAQQISQGRTDQQIESYLVDRYGASIELDPPASGWSLLVWLLPLLGGAIAVTALVVVLVRRRGAAGEEPGDMTADAAPAPEAVAERKRFLIQSLADADAEYLAGDLSDQDYLALRQRDMRRLAGLSAGVPATGPAAPVPATVGGSLALDEREPGPVDSDPEGTAGHPPSSRPAPRRRSRRSWLFLGGAVTAFGAALIVAVVMFAGARQPGQSITGTVAQSEQQQIDESLAQAATDEDSGDLGGAADLYQSVLTKHPADEVALAQLGWLEFETGEQSKNASLMKNGESKLDRAVQLDPRDYAVRLYLGTVLLQRDDNAAGAVGEYRQFLADSPPASLIEQAAPEVRQAYQEAGLPVPSPVSSGSGSSSG
jgi:cytochrome c-type biogenesis protein CcmH